MAGPTRLELATSGVTGQRSNQLNYDPSSFMQTWAVEGLNLWPSACKTDALPTELTAPKHPGYKIQYFSIKVNEGEEIFYFRLNFAASFPLYTLARTVTCFSCFSLFLELEFLLTVMGYGCMLRVC